MASNELTVVITFRDNARQAIAGVKGDLGGLKTGAGDVAKGFIAAEVAMRAFGAAFKFGLGNAIDFQKQLSQVGAVAGATTKEMQGLRDAALRIGADTSKSAGEAAQAMEILAANGLKAGDIMNGAADAAVALAEAGGTTLAVAADTASTAMAQWGMNTGQLNEVVNRLAGAANVSRFGVEDMSRAIAQGGGVAATAGVSFADFSTAIAATAASFSSGADAGTSMKTFILQLAPTTDTAKEAMKSLGLITEEGTSKFYSASGGLKSMGEIIDILKASMQGLSVEQQTVALKTIFGNDAFRTAASLMKITGQEFNAMSATMRDTSAADVAKQRMDNLSGSMEQFKGSMETLGIEVGSKLIPALTKGADGATAMVNAFGQLSGSTQALIGLTIAFTPLVSIAGSAATKIGEFWKAMNAADAAGAAARSRLALVGLGTAILAAAAAADFFLQQSTGYGLIDWMKESVTRAKALAGAFAELNKAIEGAPTHADAMAVAQRKLSEASEALSKALEEQRLVHQSAMQSDEGFIDSIKRKGDALTNWRNVMSGVPGIESEFELAIRKAQGAIEGYVMALVAAEPTHAELTRMLQELSPEAQKVAFGVSELQDAMNKHGDALQYAGEGTDFFVNTMNGLIAAGPAAAAAIAPAAEAMSTWGLRVQEAEDAVSEFNKVMSDLTGHWGAFAPEVKILEGQIAAIDVQIAELKASKDADTEATKNQIKALEELREKLQAQVDVYGANAEAIRKGSDAILGYAEAAFKAVMPTQDATVAAQGLMDEMADLVGKFHDAGIGAQDMEGFMKRLQDALAKTDAGQTLSELEKIRSDLGNEALWGEAADVVGPIITSRIEAGIASGTVSVVEAAKMLGQAAAMGVVTGIAGSGLSAEVQMELDSQITAAVNAVMQSPLEARSPSHWTARVLGLPLAEGVAVGVREGLPEIANAIGEIGYVFEEAVGQLVEHAPTMMGGFAEAIAAELQKIGDTETMGTVGAGFMSQLIEAITAGTPEAAAKLGESAARLFDQWEEELGYERANELINEFWVTVNTALATGGAEGVEALRQFFTDLNAELEGGFYTLAEGATVFGQAFQAAVDSLALDEKLGSQGRRMFDKLIAAITTGSAATLQEVAGFAAKFQTQLLDKLDPQAAAAVMEELMKALNTAITTGGAEGIEEVQHWLEVIQQISEGAAFAVSSNLVVAATTVDDFAKKLGVSADWVRQNIDAIVSTGLGGILQMTNIVPAEVASAIAELVRKLEAGLIDVSAFVAAVLAELGKIPSSVKVTTSSSGGGGGGGGGGIASGGTNAGNWSQVPGGTPNTNVVFVPAPTASNPGNYQAIPYTDIAPGTKIYVGTDSYGNSYATTSPGTIPFPGYAKGTPNVPVTGPAILHAGEAVIPAPAAALMRSLFNGITQSSTGWGALGAPGPGPKGVSTGTGERISIVDPYGMMYDPSAGPSKSKYPAISFADNPSLAGGWGAGYSANKAGNISLAQGIIAQADLDKRLAALGAAGQALLSLKADPSKITDAFLQTLAADFRKQDATPDLQNAVNSWLGALLTTGQKDVLARYGIHYTPPSAGGGGAAGLPYMPGPDFGDMTSLGPWIQQLLSGLLGADASTLTFKGGGTNLLGVANARTGGGGSEGGGGGGYGGSSTTTITNNYTFDITINAVDSRTFTQVLEQNAANVVEVVERQQQRRGR